MQDEKFVELTREQQMAAVKARFQYREGTGWFTSQGIFAGTTEAEVIDALIDLEEAEINAIGDCMGGCSMLTPRLEDFIRKP
jgi:hypothetical protein